MSRLECNACGTALPQKAAFCRQCGGKVGSLRSGFRNLVVGAAWFIGIFVWIILGAVAVFAGAVGSEAVAAAAGFLFSILFLVGLFAAVIGK